MDKLDPELLARLDVLAEKMGTTGEFAFDAMVRYEATCGWVGLIVCGFVALLCIVLIILAVVAMSDGYDEFGPGAVFICCGFAGILSIVFGSISAVSAFAPAGAAVKGILNVLG